MDDLERSLLIAITQNQKIALDFAYLHHPKLFLDPDANTIASHMVNYIKTYKSKPSQRTLVESIEKSNSEDIETIENFYNSIDQEYNESDYSFDIEQLKSKYSEQILNYIPAQFEDEEDNSNKINILEKTLTELKSVNKERAFIKSTVKDYVPDFKKDYVAKFHNPDLGRGILTGYSCLDFVKNGLRPADLLIICAETGAGKSMFLNNIAINMWMQQNKIDTNPNEYTNGCNVMYFSLEMPIADCFRRTISQLADVPSYGIRDAKLNKHEATTMAQALKFMEQYPYEFDIIDVPRGFSVNDLELHFQEARSRYAPDVIVIDYLGLMEDIDQGAETQDWLKLGELTGKVHEFARAHQIPVLSAVQLNRIDKGKKVNPIGLHRIGRSSLISHHASVIIQIESREAEETRPDFIYHIIKNRDGELIKHTIMKNFAHSRIIDKPYDIDGRANYLMLPQEDISEDMANAISNIINGNNNV